MKKLDLLETQIAEVMSATNTYDRARNNMVENYLSKIPDVFAAKYKNQELPAPICVQIEITNQCTTGCKMCNRWTWTSKSSYDPGKELSTDEQVAIFTDLAELGVRNMIWTGGEPVAHPDFVYLLAEAKRLDFEVGVLSNGVGVTEEIADGFAKDCAWVRISVDDVPNISGRKPVRNLLKEGKVVHENDGVIEEVGRSIRRLKQYIGKRNSALKVSLGYTMQKGNIQNVPDMIDFARSHNLPINFKFANGENGSYLCTEEQINWFQETILADDKILDDPLMNFRYLKDHFLKSLLVKDIVDGVPLRSYYRDSEIDCFTTSVFSLIDAFGGVYVCCHLFDDNGSLHSTIRDKNHLGTISSEHSFQDIWRSSSYNKVRDQLCPIGGHSECQICTRHWVPNTIMSNLYHGVFLGAIAKYGFEEGLANYRQASRKFEKSGAVWF